MPRYLRWIAAATSGLISQFGFFFSVGAIAVGTGNDELSGGTGLLVTLVATLIPVVVGLAVNDWLATRYPTEAAFERMRAAREAAEQHEASAAVSGEQDRGGL